MLKKYVLILIAIVIIAAAYIYSMKDKPLQNSPAEVSLAVPFTTQAPLGNWEGNENCEEASATMAASFLNGNMANTLDPSEAQKVMTDLVAWEQKNLGQNINTGAANTAKMIEQVFHLNTKQIPNFTETDLKRELANNHIILLPINAQGLNHPNYQRNNVVYHMIVIRGYKSDGFIVHDPGTEKGANNIYAYDKLYTPAADWDNTSNQLLPNQKVALVVWK